MPISALPFGSIGNFGEGAYRFVDALASAGVEFWQILPLNIQGKGNSPYSSSSAFAISHLYLADSEDYTTDRVDYREAKRKNKIKLKALLEEFDPSDAEYGLFLKNNAFWLDSFSEFYSDNDAAKIQFILRKQWDTLRRYAGSKGVKIIGDIPIYVSAESADVHSNPSLFSVGKDFTPLSVAGVPPDIFSADGQLWGNPVYNWTASRNTGFGWWINRIRYNLELFDYLRIDHFRAFSSYYSIPYGSTTAKTGVWEYAPGKEFFKKLKEALGDIKIIAEDLGEPTPDVAELLEYTGFPGMKILQLSFSGDKTNPFRLHNHTPNSVCYTGTHDNDTIIGWYASATEKEKETFNRLVPKYGGMSPAHRLIKYGDKTESELYIVPVWDILELDSSARFNIPSVEKGNWEWRIKNSDIEKLPEIIKQLFSSSDRLIPTD